MKHNLLLLTDSYKSSHFKQYPPGTERVYSYFESRGGEFTECCFFGLQYYLKEYLQGQAFTAEDLDEAYHFWNKHFGSPQLFNFAGWKHILEKHGGRLPIEIKAVPEGTVVPVGNVLMTIENTDPKCFWLTNYLETLLVQVWYGCTVATQSREMKKTLLRFLDVTGDPSLVDFKLHDFGFRGVSSVETAGVGGAAHLVNFKGTDTAVGPVVAHRYYDCPMAGFSIPASEHSTITSWGQGREVDACRNMLDQYPTGLVACVSDSFNIWKTCKDIWGGILREQILTREGVLVVRPDSGDPPTTVITVLDILAERFGTTTNSKGYKVLNPHIRMIQGDGIDRNMLEEILVAMKKHSYSADNIAFGSGGGLLQKLNRDTMKFAFKCSSVTINGREQDVFKDPVTDPGKRSKCGRLKLVKTDAGGWYTVPREGRSSSLDDLLQQVFLDGEVMSDQKFDDIRARAKC
jgi:nicotinamide phosphoribosyltransferase